MSCIACPKPIGSRAVRIGCEKCKGLYHKDCSGIAKTDWSQYADWKILFNCPKCRKSRRSSVITPSPDQQQTTEVSDVSGLRNDVSSVQDALASFKTTLGDVERSLTHLHDSMASIERRLLGFEEKFRALDDVVEENTRLKNHLDVIEERLTALENGKSKPKPKSAPAVNPTFQATIGGVKKTNDEKIDKIFETILTNLELDIKADVTKCERLSPNDASKSTLIVTLKTRDSLDNLIKAAVAKEPTDAILGGDGLTRLYINENLPTSCYRLLREAKKLKDTGFKYVWYRYGKVFVRKAEGDKVIVIKSLSDVSALVSADK